MLRRCLLAFALILAAPTAWGNALYYQGRGLPQPIINGDCLLGSTGNTAIWGSCAGGAAVSSVANSDGTLTISPTTGSVVASLALTHANTWTGTLTMSGANIALGTNSLTGNFTITGVPILTGINTGTIASGKNLGHRKQAQSHY